MTGEEQWEKEWWEELKERTRLFRENMFCLEYSHAHMKNEKEKMKKIEEWMNERGLTVIKTKHGRTYFQGRLEEKA